MSRRSSAHVRQFQATYFGEGMDKEAVFYLLSVLKKNTFTTLLFYL